MLVQLRIFNSLPADCLEEWYDALALASYGEGEKVGFEAVVAHQRVDVTEFNLSGSVRGLAQHSQLGKQTSVLKSQDLKESSQVI